MKKAIFFLLFSFFTIFAPTAFAEGSSFISIVNPIRGSDFWEIKDQKPETAVLGQIVVLNSASLPATWLLRFDALDNKIIIDKLKNRSSDEEGLFLEVTPSWADKARVPYHKSDSWHAAGSAFLTGYEREEREKLIDTAFEKFKSIFGFYPVSVGAWWIDSYSLSYMQKKYNIDAALIVADQYSTDNYQIWGQYFSVPYYPSKNNALHPAQNLDNKLNIVMMQWAARDPVNGYGNGVLESTFSVQVNDYTDYHNLDTNYFSSLVDIYTTQKFNKFNHLVVGLENSYLWSKYSGEYGKQIDTLKKKNNSGQLMVIPMKEFAVWYEKAFPMISPTSLIIADDPLGSFKKVVWFMDPYYRAGWFINFDGSVFRDIRQYIDGEEELCFKKRCNEVDFATSAIRVLDDVSFGHKWVVDEGKISNFKLDKQDDEFIINYNNEAGNLRKIEFLPRDIGIDDKIYSIDAAILNVTKKESVVTQSKTVTEGHLNWSLQSISWEIGKFLIFLILVIIFPGIILTNKLFAKQTLSKEKYTLLFLRLFLSMATGLVIFTLIFYLMSLIKIRFLIFLYPLLSLVIFFYFQFYKLLQFNLLKIKISLNLILVSIIFAGTLFQAVPTFKSGLNFSYGIGFWGPNTHDGVWHLALINQLVKSVPPENPIYSGVVLKNYHFFYDLTVAGTSYLSKVPVSDLVFRFYPILFSLMLGLGSYYLVMKLFEKKLGILKAKVAAIFSLYLIYFAGSFGWIVEFLRERHFGGESAFWVNQAVSFNLNPPFAISLVIVIAILHLLLLPSLKGVGKIIIAATLFGVLTSFKSYTGILMLIGLAILAIIKLFNQRNFSYILIFILSSLLAGWLFISNFEIGPSFVTIAPFWFIHSMVDSPDRVGWVRLSLARTSSQALGQWPKFILVETLSFVLFVIGNLGIRFLSFGLLFKIKEIFKQDVLLFIGAVSIVSLSIPILFIQSGNPWNTIQFFYPALYISALFSGVVISYLVFRLNRFIVVVLVCVFLIFSPINSFVTASGYLGKTPHAFISSKELKGLEFLSNQPDGIVLTYPYNEKLRQKLPEPWPILVYDSTAYVSALSGKSVYLEDEPQNQILLTDYAKRIIAVKNFFLEPISEGSNFLQYNHIKFIYIPKIFNVKLDENTKLIKNIFENEEVVIYQVN